MYGPACIFALDLNYMYIENYYKLKLRINWRVQDLPCIRVVLVLVDETRHSCSYLGFYVVLAYTLNRTNSICT